MRRRALLVLWLLVALLPACAEANDHLVSFNVSTAKTFAPGEPVKIHLYTHNVDALEFRVYRVKDPVRFVENLRELHSFGTETNGDAGEQIDERTWLERFHDWKQAVWSDLRYRLRSQFSHDARRALRVHQSALERHSRIVSEAEFAQVPILNGSQLVVRWRQLVPPTFISDSNTIPVPHLQAGLYLLEATDGHYKAYTLVFVTELALVTRVTGGNVGAFVVDRLSGKPQANVAVEAGIAQKRLSNGVTDANGLASLDVPRQNTPPDNFWVVAHAGNEVAVTTPYGYSLTGFNDGEFRGYAFTDRPVYRPTHTVHWKAFLRRQNGNVLSLPGISSVHVEITDAANQTVLQREMPVSPTGSVHGEYELPRNAALGYYYVRILPQAGSNTNAVVASFHVEEYRKPEYRVQVSAKEKRALQGATVAVTLDSRYFFGEPVANAKVKYRIYHATHFWWDEDEDADGDQSFGDDDMYAGDEEQEQEGKLDSNGLLTLQVPTRVAGGKGFDRPDYNYTVEAGVTDAANREITGRGSFLATYGTFRVHIEPVSYAVRAGEAARFRVTTTDYDNKPVATRVHVQLVYPHWSGGGREVVAGPAVDVTTDATGKGEGTLAVGKPKFEQGELEATAEAVQPGTRAPVDSSSLWITGADVDFGEQSSQAQLIPDKKSYAPGDVAHLSLSGDADDFYALVIAEGAALQRREVLHSSGRTMQIDLPITADSQPNVTVSAVFLRNNTLYQASKTLKVPPVQKQLQVKITPAAEVFQPQQTVSYDVETKDAAGQPVSAEFSFGVVDEAIYSIYPDTSGDMVRQLYPQRYVSSTLDSSLEYLFTGEAGVKSPMLAMRGVRYRPQMAQVKPGNEAAPKVRKAFPDTAYWQAAGHTDASGHALVQFAFPDSLTTWRATVHALTQDSSAGSASNKVLVRKDVLVRVATPRFMVQGDELTLPLITHNYLQTPLQAKLSLNVNGAEVMSAGEGNVTLPARGESSVPWRLRATHPGTVTVTGSAVAAQESDAMETSFPVLPAGVARTIARSGVASRAEGQATATVEFPAGTDPASYSLRVDVSPSLAGALLPALRYLTSFPYGCTEQTMSSFVPNLVVNETLKRLHTGVAVDEGDLKEKTDAALERLKDYQHDDGGWGWWKEDGSLVHMTAYVVGGLGQAQQLTPLSGEAQGMLERGAAYLRKQLEAHPRMRPDLRAAVVYALAMADGHDLQAPLDAEWSRRNDLDGQALALTGLAMLQVNDTRASQIAALLATKAKHQGELVFWESQYVPTLDLEMPNNVEASAYAMRLLARVHPDDPLLPGAAQWLMLHRDGGEFWVSTEQTATVLYGLVDYLAATHELEGDETVAVMVNGHAAGQHHLAATDAEDGLGYSVEIPANALTAGRNTVQIVRQAGSGRMYWSVRAAYYSTAKQDYQAGTMALNLTRDYRKLVGTKNGDHVVYTLAPFDGHAQIGDVLAVHVAINGKPTSYLLLEDPIPAGTEFVNSEDSYPIQDRPAAWSPWFTRQEFHDDHAAFFADEFTGRQEVFYLLRVVNPGSFHISPANVEAMYQPGVHASSDAQQLEVAQPGNAGGPQ